MSIQFPCSTCGKTVKAPESAVGVKVRCPYCQNVIVVPALATEEMPPLPPTEVLPSFTPIAEAPALAPAARDDRRPCPLCGEMILADAVKCRFCGEIFDATLRRSSGSMGSGSARNARDTATSLAKPPAIALIVTSSLGVFFCLIAVVFLIIATLANQGNFNKPEKEIEQIVTIVVYGILFCVYLVVLYGSIQMMKLRQYPAALTASILSIITCGPCFLGIPFGIWALVMLCDERVKNSFE